MLVLTRKLAEGIRIGDDILVKVIRTGKGSIKIGIDAPDELRVVRAELFEEEEGMEKQPVIKGLGKDQDGEGLPEAGIRATLSVVEAARLVC
ncbi:carbon storage regulator [Gimesia maris]|uniref:carbon storage regulator n=1 Tax=Gimesia maris TaxID=122 RepID=UPI0032EAC274